MKMEPRKDTDKNGLNPFMERLLAGVEVEWKALGWERVSNPHFNLTEFSYIKNESGRMGMSPFSVE